MGASQKMNILCTANSNIFCILVKQPLHNHITVVHVEPCWLCVMFVEHVCGAV